MGTATMERVPSRRQTCTFTRGSFSESSQRTIPPVRRQAPENPDFGSSRAPGSGTMVPAEARHTIASSSAIAMATPSAPVRVRARSATSCNTSSRTKCSSSQTSATQGLATLLAGATLAYLFVQAGECKQSLQSFVSRSGCTVNEAKTAFAGQATRTIRALSSGLDRLPGIPGSRCADWRSSCWKSLWITLPSAEYASRGKCLSNQTYRSTEPVRPLGESPNRHF